jgi:hypothetical protein
MQVPLDRGYGGAKQVDAIIVEFHVDVAGSA